MIVNYMDKELDMKFPSDGVRFSDHNDISSWARGAVYKCRNAGIISGVGGGRFAPKSTANRAEGATLFTQLYKKYILK